MQNNWSNFSNVSLFALCEIFRRSKGVGGMAQVAPNGKYASGYGRQSMGPIVFFAGRMS